MKLKAIRFRTHYWRPGTDYATEIAETIKNRVADNDIVAVSEKAISTASGHLIDEARVRPSKLSKLLVDPWITRVWAGPLGRITKLKDTTIDNLRNYPREEGAAHKQVALSTVGLLQSLRHYSEGGIDASNLPFSYVSLPLADSYESASRIRDAVKENTGKDVTVMIVDGDTTYSWRNLHIAPRNVSTPGLIHLGGFLTFIIGRICGLRARQTPIAISGNPINPDRALWLARRFHRLCAGGAGRTVWSMSSKMDTGLTGVTWEMLESVDHYPVSILRLTD
ncbi:MAG: coenzyme F420-0:L-glutamate ligase [Candidatus Bathyarchaeota archaeon]|nr:coenzyme F420-0:L-glutamate ligase [Candidatus Bathyarchaeota archaeon]